MRYITVCTPTYNRAHLLHRPFNSLQKQTFKNFEWLIIDDGSTDNTEEIIQNFKKIASFPIVYIKQPNQGKAAALNTSYKYINTKYVINLDSDDEIVHDALEKIHHIWETLPAKEHERFWCITGQCIDGGTGKIIGGHWPDNINNKKGKEQYKLICKYKKGEKACCRKLEILKKFPFPKYDDTKFVTENIVWENINLYYDQFCTNEIFRIYYTNSTDSLAKGSGLGISLCHSYYYYKVFIINTLWSRIYCNSSVWKALFSIHKWSKLSGRKLKTELNDLNTWYKKLFVLLTFLPVRIYMLFYKK